MKNIEDINKAQIEKLTSKKKITNFFPGDTIRVGVRIVEGKRERIQNFEGVCIAKKNRDINSSFTVRKILIKKKIPEFFAGDIVKIGVRISEGKRERIQYFEGVCIAKKNRNINSSFTVRKISFGEGVERTFALYSPVIGSIKLIRSGKVKRAKLYYLRDRKGKSARILEKIKKSIGVDVAEQINEIETEKETTATENQIKTELKTEELKNKKK